MAHQPLADDSPGSALFPEYATLYDVIAAETEGLITLRRYPPAGV